MTDDNRCAYPDGYNDLYSQTCSESNDNQEFYIADESMLVHASTGLCLTAQDKHDGYFPVLNDCDANNVRMHFNFINSVCSEGMCSMGISPQFDTTLLLVMLPNVSYDRLVFLAPTESPVSLCMCPIYVD